MRFALVLHFCVLLSSSTSLSLLGWFVRIVSLYHLLLEQEHVSTTVETIIRDRLDLLPYIR